MPSFAVTIPSLATAATIALALGGCITPTEKRAMRDDIFNVQTRLLNIEQQLVESNKEAKSTGDSASKRIASTRAELDRFQSELQRIRGEVDTLRVAAQTGQMPGADPTDEGSVAGKINLLSQRIEALETAQGELLDAIQKAGIKKGRAKDSGKNKDNGAAKSPDDLQKSFDAKRYTKVTEDAPGIVKNAKGTAKEKANYLWAESLFKLGKIRDAALRFSDLVESKPSARYAALAKVRLGDCFRHLGDGDTAKLYYEEVIKEFPNTDEASKAKDHLAEIGKGAGATDRG